MFANAREICTKHPIIQSSKTPITKLNSHRIITRFKSKRVCISSHQRKLSPPLFPPLLPLALPLSPSFSLSSLFFPSTLPQKRVGCILPCLSRWVLAAEQSLRRRTVVSRVSEGAGPARGRRGSGAASPGAVLGPPPSLPGLFNKEKKNKTN